MFMSTARPTTSALRRLEPSARPEDGVDLAIRYPADPPYAFIFSAWACRAEMAITSLRIDSTQSKTLEPPKGHVSTQSLEFQPLKALVVLSYPFPS
jgi:hypothetical protein